jgi:mannose-6-phosphate isomerase-like protein (cupin superfamily)
MYKSGDSLPAWCELRRFDIYDLGEGGEVEVRRQEPHERVLVTRGTVQLVLPDATTILKESQFYDMPDTPTWRLRGCSTSSQVARLSGRWGPDIGGCGLFRVASQERPVNIGDPVAYRKTTSVDNHYHDCDEYWIVLEGRGTVAIGDRLLPVGPGDCVAIGMGHHHDFPLADEPVKAVFFETTLRGSKRVGHLWNHTHGEPEPAPQRI